MEKYELPKSLINLIQLGIWPSSKKDAHKQNLKPILGKDAACKLSKDNDRIYLEGPPFITIEEEAISNRFWYDELTNVGEIDYKKAVIIGDFGIGSDSAIILYYGNTHKPSIMYLKWSFKANNIHHSWVETHSCFDDFAIEVGLIKKNRT